jgi:hypothetical protein
MLRKFLLPFPFFMEPDGGGGTGGTGNAEEKAKITLPGGIVVEVPKAQAEQFHAAQQKHNAERDELARKVGAAEAERKAAEDRAAAEARDKEAMRLAKDGEIAKARELLTAESNAKLAKVGDRMKRQELEAAVRRLTPGIETTAVADIVALVSSRAAFNADTGEVTFTDGAGAPMVKDGKPVGADAFLTDYLSARKHFQPAKVPASTGGSGSGDPPAPPGTIRRADVPNMTPAQAALMVAGKLTVVD